jgi:hypothetical protein
MPDLQDYAIVPLAGNAYRIEADVVESRRGGRVLRSHRGATAITFPAVLAQLDADQRRQVVELVAPLLIRFLTPEAEGA